FNRNAAVLHFGSLSSQVQAVLSDGSVLVQTWPSAARPEFVLLGPNGILRLKFTIPHLTGLIGVQSSGRLVVTVTNTQGQTFLTPSAPPGTKVSPFHGTGFEKPPLAVVVDHQDRILVSFGASASWRFLARLKSDGSLDEDFAPIPIARSLGTVFV